MMMMLELPNQTRRVRARAGQLHRDPMISLNLEMPLLALSSWIVYCLIDSEGPDRPCRAPSPTAE